MFGIHANKTQYFWRRLHYGQLTELGAVQRVILKCLKRVTYKNYQSQEYSKS